MPDYSTNNNDDKLVIIKMAFQEVEYGSWIGLIWFRIGTGGGLFECGNESSVSIKCGEFLN